MTLDTVAALSQILGVGIVLVGLWFGLEQLRQMRTQRRDTSAIELVRSIQDAEFTRAFRLIYSLPDGTNAADLRARGREYEDAAQIVGSRLETVGVLVFRGAIPFEVMADLAGGVTVALWHNLEPWVTEMRALHSQPMYLEWFQWLAEQFATRNRTEQLPAFVRHKAWSPSVAR